MRRRKPKVRPAPPSTPRAKRATPPPPVPRDVDRGDPAGLGGSPCH